jgi:transcriptional regulator with XRE-family HTH domain
MSKARIKKNYSQKELAKKLGYRSGQHISNIERGLCKIPTKRLVKLCSALDIKPNTIIPIMVSDFKKELNRILS